MNERSYHTIRPFETRDAARVSEIVRGCLCEVNAGDFDSETLGRFIAEHDPEGILARSKATTCLVAESGGEVAGTGSLCGDRIVNVFVSPDRHRLGIGRSIVRHLEEIAEKRGIRTVYLLSARIAAGWYLRLGYEPIGEVSGGQVRMRKVLLPGKPHESSRGRMARRGR